MSHNDALYRVRLAADGNNAQQVQSIEGADGGFLFPPQHIIFLKIGHLHGVLLVVGNEHKLSTRLMDACCVRGFIPDGDLLARIFASWVTGPERWSQLFFSAHTLSLIHI